MLVDTPVPRKIRASDLLLDGAIVFTLVLFILTIRLPLFTGGLYTSSNFHAFGTATSGEIIKKKFVLRNLHPWSVTVTQLKGTCGCTRGFVGRTLPFTLRPFEAVEVIASFDTTGRKGEAEQLVEVVTSDGERTSLTFAGSLE